MYTFRLNASRQEGHRLPRLTFAKRPSVTVGPRIRATLYAAVLLAINIYFVKALFFVDFTNNMQTNAGSFMAIGRFIARWWPHLDWYP